MRKASADKIDSRFSARSRLLPVFSAILITGCATARPLTTAIEEALTRPAEEDGWELVFRDDFDRDEIGNDWRVLAGKWAIERGALVGAGTLVSSAGFPGPDPYRTLPGEAPPGFIRLEFEATLDAAQRPNGTPEIIAILHAQPVEEGALPTHDGYLFRWGGVAGSPHLLRNGEVLVGKADAATAPSPGRRHRIIVENDEGRLRMRVDGRRVLEHAERAIIVDHGYDRVVLHFGTPARIESLRVYVKRLPEGYF